LLGWRADIAAGCLGALAALALPPFTLLPVLLISIPGLLTLIDATATWRGAARRGLVFGIAHHLVGLYWVTNAILVQAADFWWAVPVAVPLLAAVLAVFIAIPCGIARPVQPGWRRVAVLAGCWVAGDLARQFVLTGFPWNPLGSAWEMPGTLGLVFMQGAAWVGVGGLTLFTLLLASAPVLGWRGRLGAAGFVALWAAGGAARLALPAGAPPGLTAVIVQGNISEIEHRDHWRDNGWTEGVFNRHLALTRAGVARAGGARALVVWPETASPYWLAQDAGARQAIAAAARPAAATIAGTPRGEGPSVAYNSLAVVLPDASVAATYDKVHLVPYGEYFPAYLPIRLGEQGWTPGPGLRTLHVPGLPPIGPTICFEAAFPAQVVVERDRPAFMLNLTNDSWFGDSAGPRQHLAAARMRAVEEGLPMVRAANTGISAVIDAHGRVVASLGLNRADTLVAPIPGYMGPTPVSRMGLAAPLLLAIFSCAAGLGIGRRRGISNFKQTTHPKNAIFDPES
jgi:apolipoprotein N-acyltransferase